MQLVAIFALIAAFASAPALAQQRIYYKLSAGTGFLVNREGHVVTNEHVVRGCRSISIRTQSGDIPARLVARDPSQDLAVLALESTYQPRETAPLRWNIRDLRVGDEVIVMGFPGQSGIRAKHEFKKTRVTAMKGPTGEDRWIQLESVVRQGNSGGPVLDMAGHVIAVVSGVVTTYRVAPDGSLSGEAIGKADVAITLAALQDFLRDNAISFYESQSGLIAHSDGLIAQRAHDFIVPVHCVQSEERR
jgi:S1-C subfamily serine protease